MRWASLRDAQSRLNELVYNAGTPDGAMGGKTTAALRTFLQNKGLPTSGQLDAATAAELAR
ncbi:MAG: peptidoglycan-binding protein [Acidovorax sp.]|nr:peptidoglycan-binding protein [Acidovorax sp.]